MANGEDWNEDEGVLDTQLVATHEEQSDQPAGTITTPINILNFLRLLNQFIR